MFKKRTAIVVGAGASYDLGFPVGAGLKYEIAKLLSPTIQKLGQPTWDDRLSQAFTKLGGSLYQWRAASKAVAEAMPVTESIDNFLHTHQASPEIIQCGKLAICSRILSSENGSALFAPGEGRPDLGKDGLRNYWMNRFCNRLFLDADVADVVKIFDTMTFVIFNYDRCVEAYLIEAVRRHFLLSEKAAAEIIGRATFYHPYGTVGALPWQYSGGPTARFGYDASAEELIDIATGISTFTESRAKGEALEDIRERYATAEQIIYLGFSFGAQNMRLLRADRRQDHHNVAYRSVYATALAASKGDLLEFRRAINDSFYSTPPATVDIENMTCTELFNAYARIMAA